MAVNGAPQRLVQKYAELNLWTQSDDPVRNRFVLQGYDVRNTNANPVAEAASNSTNRFTIRGLITPPEELQTKKLIKIEIEVPMLYPHEPPIVYVKSPISHPNVDHLKRLCTSCFDLEKNWKQCPLSDVIKTVIRTFDEPDADYAVHVGMASLFGRNRSEYNQTLAQMIEQHGESP